MKFLHTMIRVKNLDESLKFYRDFLGLNLVKEKRLKDCTLYFLSDEDGQTQVELTLNDETPKDGYMNGNAFGHLAFSTPDIKDFSKKMKEYGYKYLWEPYKLTEIGSTIAFLKDPDGNEIEIIEDK